MKYITLSIISCLLIVSPCQAKGHGGHKGGFGKGKASHSSKGHSKGSKGSFKSFKQSFGEGIENDAA